MLPVINEAFVQAKGYPPGCVYLMRIQRKPVYGKSWLRWLFRVPEYYHVRYYFKVSRTRMLTLTIDRNEHA